MRTHIQNSKVFHDGKEQGLSLAHETALNQREIISHVGDNLGCVEYNIAPGFSWTDVDSVIAEVDAASKEPMPPNMGSNLIGMLIDGAQESAEGLRDRISNVRSAPIDTAIVKNCECIHFDFDGKAYLGELRGRNRDLCIDPHNPESDPNRAIAARVLLDQNASILQTEQALPERKMENSYINAASVALQVLEAIRATNPNLIADHMPAGWGMNKLREGLRHEPRFGDAAETKTMDAATLVTVNLNVLDDEGNVVDGTTATLSVDQLSDIVDHAAQLILVRRDGQSLDSVLDELDEALSVAGVIDAATDSSDCPRG